LSYNKLKEIPKEIGSLINLKRLDLDYNQLGEIPKELRNLKNCAPVGRPSHNKSLKNFYYVLYNKKLKNT
jgi:Leucine-rich repeat (LRR) protein